MDPFTAWPTYDGRHVPLTEMETEHLEKALDVVTRNGSPLQGRTERLGWFRALKNELARRREK